MKDPIQAIEKSTWADRTKKQRIAYIKNLKKILSPTSSDYSFLSNVNAVKDHVFASLNPTSRKTNILIIKAILQLIESPIAKKYEKLAQEVISDSTAHQGNNVVSKENTITFHEMLELPEKIKEDLIFMYDKVFLNDKEIKDLKTESARYRYLKLLTEYIILILYTQQAPLRGGDWATVKLRKSKLNSANWYDAKKGVLHMNDFKNAKSMGSRSWKLEPEIIDLLDKYIDVLESIIDNPEYLIYNVNAKKHSIYTREIFSIYTARLLKKLSGKPITVNSLRHIYESYLINHPDYNKLTIGQKNELHERLLHSRGTAQDYVQIVK